ncbi:sugar ABC transporter substrate-binding protein [Oceanobacillus arenosus]|uniref:Sugar ABC transporter substrate-binding protein n=1 Tax=Oceanobacillus arenosus TaxID=1229153 RepID=A0A3D8Q163_9BACI|nr:extracellular solute-binding protein [Oceanobacillus arenosus]RDW22176.1 sugar ABC transporter substrate-binding protein [Oceanobacillus arenosus]
MRKRKLKLLLILFVFCLLFILGACQSDNKASTSDDNDSTTITLWHIATAGQKETLENAVARFEEKHEGVHVELVQQENDPYKTKLSVAMGGGTPPDVFHSWGGGWLEKFVEAGQVKEITEEIDAENYLEAGLAVSTFDDKVYGAPLGMSLVPVWYNKQIFQEYNLAVPETYDELLTVIETLKSNDIIPFALANQSKWPGAFYLMYFAERIGGPDLFNEAYKRDGRGFDDQAYVEAGQKIQDLVEMGAFPDGVNGMNYDTGQSRQLIYSEKAAMITQVTSFLDNTRKDAPGFEEKLGFFPFPSIEGGKGDKSHLVGGVSPTFSVSEKSKHPDLATELVKELTSIESGQDLVDLAGGIAAIKNVTYEDEFSAEMYKLLNEAEYLQTFYDQTLPPEVATEHLDTTQALFGLTITPEEAAKKVEASAKEALK